MKKAALHNLGCKVNAYETEAMQEMLEQAGYEIVPFKEGADVYIINTCTVTNIADRKSRQMLHRARKLNPDAVVVAAGCYVQAQEGKEIDPCIDIVIGNNHKKDLPELLKQYEMEKSGHTEYAMEDINRTKEYEELHLTKPGDHTRAYIKVQDGCNQFCTYCIIPSIRGNYRSVPLEDLVAQAKELADMLLDRKKEGTLQVVRAYTSPQLRAAQTAQEAAIALDIPCIAADGLREMDMGDWEGRSWESITQENAKEYQDWDANRRYVHTPHGECYNEVLRRALDTLGMILERETEDVLIVTHSGVLMALRCYIAGQTFEEMGIIRYKTKNAEVVEIFADDVKDAIERFQKGE